MPDVFDKLYLDLDFEFSRSSEPVPYLVSVSMKCDGKQYDVWLRGKKKRQASLAKFILKRKDTHIIRAYGAVAECRCLQALGLDPADFQVIDLFFEHRQLTHNYKKYAYGNYFTKTGMRRFSVAPSYIKEKNIDKDNNKIGMGYVDAVAHHFGEFIDSKHKKSMRNLIIADKDHYTKSEIQAILDYGASDIKWLPKLHQSMTTALYRVIHGKIDTILKYQLTRGEYAPSLAKMEFEGFPLKIEWVKNLRRNFEGAKDTLVQNLCETYPFFLKQKKRKRDLIGDWTFKYSQFEKFINECEHISWEKVRIDDPKTGKKRKVKQWPLSDKTKKYKTDEKTLEEYDGIPELYALRQCNKLLGQLKWFQIPEDPKDDFFNNVGPDGRLRGYLGPYGTITSRNAPKAKQFILAMSAWLRCLIQPKEGEAIVGVDWASEEFIIAAELSGDADMKRAYASRDPYLWFAIRARSLSKTDGTWWKEEKANFKKNEKYKCSDLKKFKKISKIRDLFKSTTLGLQYGMGYAKLSIKLTADCSREVDEIEAMKLIALHKRTYPTYWRWWEKISNTYHQNKFLLLDDGWALMPDNDNDLSVRNFPTQGTGAVIMRLAVKLFQKEGGRVMGPLHDAIYAIYNVKTEAHHPELLGKCMQKAVEMVFDEDVVIRQDLEIHDHTHIWVNEKGEKHYKLLNKYLEFIPTEGDILDRLDKKVYRFVA